jgi:hypothetical protein
MQRSKSKSIGRKFKNNEKRPAVRVFVSSVYATAATILFAFLCPAVVVAAVIAYGRFIRLSSVDIEWNVFGMLADPWGLFASGVVWVATFAWKFYR